MDGTGIAANKSNVNDIGNAWQGLGLGVGTSKAREIPMQMERQMKMPMQQMAQPQMPMQQMVQPQMAYVQPVQPGYASDMNANMM